MDEKKQDNTSEKTIIQEQINDKTLSDNKSSKSKKTENPKVIHFQMFSCLKCSFNYLKIKYNSCTSNCLLFTQFLIFVVFLDYYFFSQYSFYIISDLKEYLNLIIFLQ